MKPKSEIKKKCNNRFSLNKLKITPAKIQTDRNKGKFSLSTL